MLLSPHQNPDADRVSTIPLMSAEIASSCPLPEFPSEIWLDIFRLATCIPFETDISVNIVEPGLFCSSDHYQLEAVEKVLPLRRAVVQVSRRFYQIGTEVLYTAFHANPLGIRHPYRRLSLFSDLLVLRPELGRFVKRLSLVWSRHNEEKNYKIISHCPNMFIFSSPQYHLYNEGLRPWWGRGLPKTIRSFDAEVYKIPVNDILSLLEMLPHIEVLHLGALIGHLVPHAPVCLAALRILSIYYCVFHFNISLSPPLSPVMQLPSLTTLATDVLPVHAIPLDALRGLEYFQVSCQPKYRGHLSDYFDNLRYLEILTDYIGFWDWLTYFPLHQLECITVKPAYHTLERWGEAFRVDFLMPLDAKAMPKLKRFELVWGTTGIYGYYHEKIYRTGIGKYFIGLFEILVRRFEQRNVLFVEKRGIEIYPRFQPVHDVLIACKRP